ncbi:MAG: hypothetical protein LBD12_06375 [Clostridiales Family XIII bacterium]|jgi:hypothetical protein|nr:hypothetical protein [Clostridiales Family XIII bacterium]
MRDFLYNKSDVITAVAIILIAVLVIYSRADALMGGAVAQKVTGSGDIADLPVEIPGDEPEVADADAEAEATPPEDDGTAVQQPVDAQQPAGDVQEDAQVPEPSVTAPDTSKKPVKFTIEVGSDSGLIAKNLVAAGLVPSSKAFLKEVRKLKAETKLKAGTFKITPGTSIRKIVRILTD